METAKSWVLACGGDLQVLDDETADLVNQIRNLDDQHRGLVEQLVAVLEPGVLPMALREDLEAKLQFLTDRYRK